MVRFSVPYKGNRRGVENQRHLTEQVSSADKKKKSASSGNLRDPFISPGRIGLRKNTKKIILFLKILIFLKSQIYRNNKTSSR